MSKTFPTGPAPGHFLLPAGWVVPFLAETVLSITLLPGIQITCGEESPQKTCRGSASRPGGRAKSRTSGDCPRDRASRGANHGSPGSLTGHLPAPPRPWPGDAYVCKGTGPLIFPPLHDITLCSLGSHLDEMLIGSQNWAFSRARQAGKNHGQTYGQSQDMGMHGLILVRLGLVTL
jgi:hypothetical protein